MASESAYLHDLLHDDESDPGHRPDLAFDANSFCSDGRDDFSLLSSEDNDRDSISEGSSESHDDVRASGGVQAPSEIAFSQDITKKNDSSGPGNENGIVCFIAKSNVNHFEEWKKYATKNGGRHKFQVDLGIALVNHAIKAEWTDLDKPRPKWMRQAQLLPCECNKCFFCVNKLTNGIHHKESLKVIVYHSKGKYKTNKCTEERIALWSSGSYCRQCYRNMPKGMDSKEKRRSCKTSKMGCPSCWEPICNACWENGYDQH